MQKRIYDLKPHQELWSYDYDPNTIYILERLTDENGSKAAIVRRIVSYWTNEKAWIFTNVTSEHSHADNVVEVREFTPVPTDVE